MKNTPSTHKAVKQPKPRSIIFWSAVKWSQIEIVGYGLSDWAVKSLNSLFTVSDLRFVFRYHAWTIKVLINKRVCDHVPYSTSIGNHAHTCTRSHVDNQRAFVYLRNTSGRWRRHWFTIQHGAARVTPLYINFQMSQVLKHDCCNFNKNT